MSSSKASNLEFSNVTVTAKANVYFDGKVVSHTLVLSDGSKKTLGLIYPGEYHFGTQAPERMDISAGSCRVKLDGQGAAVEYAAGSGFDVPGSSGFTISVERGITEYVCSFG
jgi:purine/pyrimidine-nucleoside phosphorylase